MYSVNTVFSDWLSMKIREKGWNKSELARRSGLSAAAISDVITGRREPGAKLCKSIAAALKVPVDEVYQVAGLLPPEPENDQRFYRIQTLYHTLREDGSKERALQFLEFLSGLEEKNDRTGKRTKRDP